MISGADGPDHPDREPGLQSLLLDVIGQGVCEAMQEPCALRRTVKGQGSWKASPIRIRIIDGCGVPAA